MKQIIIFFLFFISINLHFCQTSQNSESKKVEILNKKVDSLIKIQNESKVKILEERMTQATETISNQNAMVSAFGTLYTIITIILALIGVVLPILTYQFGIRPSQKALEDFEKNSEKKFNEFLKSNVTKEIDNAIENLNNQDLAIKNSAINFLSLNYHLGINNLQILEIIKYLNSNGSIDDTTKSQLFNTISNQKNENVFNYFKEQLKIVDEKNILIYYAIKSFSFFDYHLYKDELKEYMKKNQNLLTVSTYIQLVAKHHLLDFFNDTEILSILSPEEKKQINDNWKYYLDSWKISENDFKETELFKRTKAE